MNQLTPCLSISASRLCKSEKEYVFNWVLTEVLGLTYQVKWVDEPGRITLEVLGQTGVLELEESFFAAASGDWLGPSTLPSSVCWLPAWRMGSLDSYKVPIFNFGGAEPCDRVIARSSDQSTARIEFDLFGWIFFLISRYEEAVNLSIDAHSRFPSFASILYRSSLLERPIVNEYIELLWCKLKSLWPGLERRLTTFTVVPSHDIDTPSADWCPLVASARALVGAARRGRFTEVASLWNRIRRYRKRANSRRWREDPNDTIDWIMDQSEESGLRSAFYYIPCKTSRFDPGMPLDHPHVVDQWRRIATRGHEIGVHPGYETYNRPARLRTAVDSVRQQLTKLGIEQPCLGGRQHFLRWKTPDTAVYLDNAGLNYDTTLSFADRAGFRCGTCYEFPMYDLRGRKPLKLRQRPLVVMECSVLDARYMGLGCGQEAFDFIVGLKAQCRRYSGNFTVLWHNQRFRSAEERDFYKQVLVAEN